MNTHPRGAIGGYEARQRREDRHNQHPQHDAGE
jgi:hypothetical protein